MATEKAPFIWYMLGLFLVFTILTRNGVYSVAETFFVFVLCVISLTVMYLFTQSLVFSGHQNLFSRAIMGSAQPHLSLSKFFPKVEYFLLGLSFPNPGNIFSFENFPITTEILKWAEPEASIGVAGSHAGSILGRGLRKCGNDWNFGISF